MTDPVALLLSLALLSGPVCPPASEVEACEDCEVVELPAGCPSPIDGFLLRPEAMEAMAKDLAWLDSRVESCKVRLARTREDRAIKVRKLAEAVIACSNDVEALADKLAREPEPPSRAVWFAVGSASMAIALAVVMGVVGE